MTLFPTLSELSLHSDGASYHIEIKVVVHETCGQQAPSLKQSTSGLRRAHQQRYIHRRRDIAHHVKATVRLSATATPYKQMFSVLFDHAEIKCAYAERAWHPPFSGLKKITANAALTIDYLRQPTCELLFAIAIENVISAQGGVIPGAKVFNRF